MPKFYRWLKERGVEETVRVRGAHNRRPAPEDTRHASDGRRAESLQSCTSDTLGSAPQAGSKKVQDLYNEMLATAGGSNTEEGRRWLVQQIQAGLHTWQQHFPLT